MEPKVWNENKILHLFDQSFFFLILILFNIGELMKYSEEHVFTWFNSYTHSGK